MAELRQMSKAMIHHEGLLNHAQAALVLDVSARRIGELVELGKLTRFNFLGRTYVSVLEIHARRDSDLKAGRPPRTTAQRIKTTAKALTKVDPVQLGMFAVTPEPKKKKAK